MSGERKSLFHRIADRSVDTPWRLLLGAVLLLGAILPGLARVRQDLGYRVWFQPDDPNLRVLDEFEEQFGSDIASLIVVHSPSGIFDKDSAKLVVDLTDRMWKVAGTIRVESLANYSWVHPEGDDIIVENLIPNDRELTDQLLAERKAVALGHEQLPGYLVRKAG